MAKNNVAKKYLPKMVGIGLNGLGVLMPKKSAELALDIFCSPRKGRIESYQKKFLKKFKQTTLDFNGVPIMTYDNGKEGKKVLLCHGWESNSYRWRKLYRALKDTNLNIIMMDAPAHGGTGGDRFQALLYGQMINMVAEHYKPEVIIGHSVGGYSTIYYMSQYQPSFIKDLIILASPDKLVDITQRYFKMIGLGGRVGKKYYSLIKNRFGKDITFYNAADFAGSIKVSGLIIHDEGDDVNLYYEAEAIHKQWSKSELETTQNLGHSLQGEEVYQRILEYLS